MVKSFVFIACVAVVVFFVPTGVHAQTLVNAAGSWNITSTGEAFATGLVRIAQRDLSITGTYGQGGRIDGKFQPGTSQVDANWRDSRGDGWMTIVFAADGSRFSGQWGRPGSNASGQFVAVRAPYPSVSGDYNVTVTGGPEFTTRRISLHQLALDVVGNYGPGTQLNGAMATNANTLTGTWKGTNANGWLKLQFADDSKSFQGTWGLASDAAPSGQITGSVVSTAQLRIAGVWQIASSGAAFTANMLKIQQKGQTITGSYKGGRLQGTLPRGSSLLSGNWKDSHDAGVLLFKFAPDGMSFQGTWTTKRQYEGSIIGKRLIAGTPALRH